MSHRCVGGLTHLNATSSITWIRRSIQISARFVMASGNSDNKNKFLCTLNSSGITKTAHFSPKVSLVNNPLGSPSSPASTLHKTELTKYGNFPFTNLEWRDGLWSACGSRLWFCDCLHFWSFSVFMYELASVTKITMSMIEEVMTIITILILYRYCVCLL